MSAERDVVIVGAGAAGIAAMRRLAVSRLSSIVLEATARVGGRAWTCDVAGMRLDLGCGWLIPPIATHGLGLPTRPALLSIVALLRGAASITTSASRKRSRPPRGAPTAWEQRMELTPPKSDCAADALEPEGEWNTYLQAISSFMSGAGLEHVSVADYTAYDAASTGCNWRTPGGYGH